MHVNSFMNYVDLKMKEQIQSILNGLLTYYFK